MTTLRISPLDHLRHLAAVAVLFSHSYALTGVGHDPLQRWTGTLDAAGLAVDFFFCLSGFLMYGALQRDASIPRFVRNRLARIVPGLAVCVLLTVIVGSILSSLGIQDYWRNVQTWKYLSNMVFVFTPRLPGVFQDQPYPGVVNGSLWTLAYEIGCYAVVTLLAALPARRRVAVFGLIALACATVLLLRTQTGPTAAGNAARLLFFFALGHAAAPGHAACRRIRVTLVLALGLGWLAELPSQGALQWHLVAAIVCITALDLARRWASSVRPLKFDFSFGMYIYAFPIQQWLAGLAVSWSPPALFLASLALVLPFAAASWFAVERPCLRFLQRALSRRDFREHHATTA